MGLHPGGGTQLIFHFILWLSNSPCKVSEKTYEGQIHLASGSPIKTLHAKYQKKLMHDFKFHKKLESP